jgi:hypothetical protein
MHMSEMWLRGVESVEKVCRNTFATLSPRARHKPFLLPPCFWISLKKTYDGVKGQQPDTKVSWQHTGTEGPMAQRL